MYNKIINDHDVVICKRNDLKCREYNIIVCVTVLQIAKEIVESFANLLYK